MIKLYGFGKGFGVVDASPFVVKVDLFMRMAKLPFECENDFNNIKKSPKHKLPFIEDKGLKVADSASILKYLTDSYDLHTDDFLTEQQKAQGKFISHALDESLYWCLVYSRWMKDDTWPVINKAFFDKMPIPFKWFLPSYFRKDVKNTLFRQGFGRHSEAELLTIADEQFSSLSVLLAKQDYLYGDKICSYDAVVYSHLIQFIAVDFCNNFNQLVKKHENLVTYCQRIEAAYY